MHAIGEIVQSVGRYEHPSPVLDSHDSMIAPVLKVDVNVADTKEKFRVNASFSMSAAISVISERLANRINLPFSKKDVIEVVSPRCWKREVYFPGTCLTVECISDVTSRARHRSADIECSVLQVAPVICPTMTIDLLVGRDWLQRFGEKTCVIYGPGDHSSKIKCATGVNIALPWERLDCGHHRSRYTSYSDHILAINNEDVLARLDTIRGYSTSFTHNSTETSFNPYPSVKGEVEGNRACWLDSVMSQHDILPRNPTDSDRQDVKQVQSSVMYQQEEKDAMQMPYTDDDVSGISEKEEEDVSRSLPLYPWEEFITPEGAVYYYNSETGESSWEMY